MVKICLRLCGKTLEENLVTLEKYRKQIDMVELCADYLEPSELFSIRTFPERAKIPTILRVLRKCDGGVFSKGEGMRLLMFARGLSFANSNPKNNFAYIDLEYDFHIPSIQEAARTFGTRIIRSRYFLDGVPDNLEEVWNDLTSRHNEVPKLSVHCNSLADVNKLFDFFKNRKEERIVDCVGEFSLCTKVLSNGVGSMLVYTDEQKKKMPFENMYDEEENIFPEKWFSLYRFRNIDNNWNLFGLIGNNIVSNALSPIILNKGFASLNLNSVVVPFPVENEDDFFHLADLLSIKAFSVSGVYKESILEKINRRSLEVDYIGACNTVVRENNEWVGYNTDAYGFSETLLKFMGITSLKNVGTAIIGASGMARAAAYVLHNLGARVCIISKNISHAKHLAEMYNFKWAGMTERATELIENYNDLIIQASLFGIKPNEDPLEWYEFTGNEAFFETIYYPAETAILRRAKNAGCRVTNGFDMISTQAKAQFLIFSGKQYPKELNFIP